MRRNLLSITVALFSIACGSTPSTPDAPTLDTGTDGGGVDTGVPTDTGVPVDTGVPSDTPVDAPPTVPDRAILVVGDLDPIAGFAATSFRTYLATQGAVTEMADPTLNAALLGGYDLVVFGDLVDALNGAERGAVITWVTTGGSAIVLSGYNTTDRAEAQSVTSVFQLDVDQTRTDFPTAVTVFVPGAVTRGTLTDPPPIAGTYVIADFSDASALEIETVAGDHITARWVSAAPGGGRALVHLDDHATLDMNWNADVEQFWSNTFAFLFP